MDSTRELNSTDTAIARSKMKSGTSTRDLLLKTVSELMTEQQSVDVSLSVIGERSGLNTALVKYYFGSKSGLLLALVIQVIGASLEKLSHLVEMDLPADEKLNLHIRAVVSTYYDYPYVNRLLDRVGHIEDGKFGKKLADEIVTPLHEAEKKILEQGRKAGLFKDIDPVFFYFHVLGACDAMFHSEYALKHAFGVKKITKRFKNDYADQISTIILNGIATDHKKADARD